MKEPYRIHSVPRTFEQVAQRIVEFIVSRDLPVGSKLPTERQLNRWMEVSRSSVREGIRVLELLGFLETRHGGGTFVASPHPFILPKSKLGIPLEKDEMDSYFEVAWHAASQLILFAVRKGSLEKLKQSVTDFREKQEPLTIKQGNAGWGAFHQFVGVVGQSFPHGFWGDLWDTIYNALDALNYFSQRLFHLDMELLVTSFSQKDEHTVYDCLTDFTPR